MRRYLGVDFGTTHLKGSVVTATGTLLGTVTRPYREVADLSELPAMWWHSFLDVVSELAKYGGTGPIERCTISGMAPNVILTSIESEGDDRVLLFHSDVAVEIEARLDRELGSAKWANEVLSKIIWLKSGIGSSILTPSYRFHSTHSYILWRACRHHVIDPIVVSECGTLCTPGGWSEVTIDRFALEWVQFPEIVPVLESGFEIVEAELRSLVGDSCRMVMGSSDSVATAVGAGVWEVGDILVYYGTFNSATQLLRGMTSVLCEVEVLPCFDWFCSLPLSGAQVSQVVTLLFGEEGWDRFFAEAERAGRGSDGVRFVHTPLGTRSTISTLPEGALFGVGRAGVNRGSVARAMLEGFALALKEFADSEGVTLDGRVGYASGGGASRAVWRQIVAEVTGLSQIMLRETGGAWGTAVLGIGSDLGIGHLAQVLDSKRIQADVNESTLEGREEYLSVSVDYKRMFGWGLRR